MAESFVLTSRKCVPLVPTYPTSQTQPRAISCSTVKFHCCALGERKCSGASSAIKNSLFPLNTGTCVVSVVGSVVPWRSQIPEKCRAAARRRRTDHSRWRKIENAGKIGEFSRRRRSEGTRQKRRRESKIVDCAIVFALVVDPIAAANGICPSLNGSQANPMRGPQSEA